MACTGPACAREYKHKRTWDGVVKRSTPLGKPEKKISAVR